MVEVVGMIFLVALYLVILSFVGFLTIAFLAEDGPVWILFGIVFALIFLAGIVVPILEVTSITNWF